MGRTAAIMIVDCIERKHMKIPEIAAMLNRSPERVEEFIEKIKASSAYEKILEYKNRKVPPQALSETGTSMAGKQSYNNRHYGGRARRLY